MSPLATTQLGVDSAWAVYAAGALFIIGGAFGVVLQRNPVHCALSLVVTIFGIALLFIDQGANFLAAVQIIVYGGAIVILFLFVIMLLGVDRKEPRTQQKLRSLTPVAIVVSLVALVELLVLTRVHYWATGATSATEKLSGPGTDIQKLGQTIFTAYLLPFEMTSALLVIAVVAAVVLVRRGTQAPAGGPRKTAAGARPASRLPEAPLPTARASGTEHITAAQGAASASQTPLAAPVANPTERSGTSPAEASSAQSNPAGAPR